MGGKTRIGTLRIITLQKRAFRITHNQHRNSHAGSFFKKSNVLKFEDKIPISNIIFISKSINNLLPPIFKNWFILCPEIHNYVIVLSPTDKLLKPFYRTDSYGRNSIIVSAINCSNKTQNKLRSQSLTSLHPIKIKNMLTQRCISNYQ